MSTSFFRHFRHFADFDKRIKSHPQQLTYRRFWKKQHMFLQVWYVLAGVFSVRQRGLIFSCVCCLGLRRAVRPTTMSRPGSGGFRPGWNVSSANCCSQSCQTVRKRCCQVWSSGRRGFAVESAVASRCVEIHKSTAPNDAVGMPCQVISTNAARVVMSVR